MHASRFCRHGSATRSPDGGLAAIFSERVFSLLLPPTRCVAFVDAPVPAVRRSAGGRDVYLDPSQTVDLTILPPFPGSQTSALDGRFGRGQHFAVRQFPTLSLSQTRRCTRPLNGPEYQEYPCTLLPFLQFPPSYSPWKRLG